MHLVPLSCLVIYPFGLIKSTCIVRSQIHHYDIRLPAGKIKILITTKLLIHITLHQTTYLSVVLWKCTIGIVIPGITYTPAALGKDTVLCIQFLCSQIGIITQRREEHGYPVLLLSCAKGSFSGGNAVTDKFKLTCLIRYRIKNAIMT